MTTTPKDIIIQLSSQILIDIGLRHYLTEPQLFEIGQKLLEMKPQNKIEKRVLQRSFEVLKGVIKMKKYGRKPHKKFRHLLMKIGYFSI